MCVRRVIHYLATDTLMLFHANQTHLCERARSRHRAARGRQKPDGPAVCPRDIAQFQAHCRQKLHHAYYSRPNDLESCCWLLSDGVHVFVNKMRRGQIDAEWVQPWVQFGKSRTSTYTPRARTQKQQRSVNASIWVYCSKPIAFGHAIQVPVLSPSCSWSPTEAIDRVHVCARNLIESF
jgi:hypothetical protein